MDIYSPRELNYGHQDTLFWVYADFSIPMATAYWRHQRLTPLYWIYPTSLEDISLYDSTCNAALRGSQ